MSGSNTGMGKMHLDLYTNNAALTQKARFWCNFVSSLKGEFDGLGVEREREDGVRDARASLASQGLAQQSHDAHNPSGQQLFHSLGYLLP